MSGRSEASFRRFPLRAGAQIGDRGSSARRPATCARARAEIRRTAELDSRPRDRRGNLLVHDDVLT